MVKLQYHVTARNQFLLWGPRLALDMGPLSCNCYGAPDRLSPALRLVILKGCFSLSADFPSTIRRAPCSKSTVAFRSKTLPSTPSTAKKVANPTEGSPSRQRPPSLAARKCLRRCINTCNNNSKMNNSSNSSSSSNINNRRRRGISRSEERPSASCNDPEKWSMLLRDFPHVSVGTRDRWKRRGKKKRCGE